MKYAIAPEGIEALTQLSKDLREAAEDIDVQASSLVEKVNGVEDEIGVFYKDILVLTKEILVKNAEAKEMVDALANISIPKLISEIELYMLI